MLAGLRHAQDHGTGLAQSVPLRPLASPPLSVAGSQVSSLDLGAGFSPDPILFEDVHTTTTTFGSTSPPDTSANLPTPPSTLGSLHPPFHMHHATPLFPLSSSSPSSTPLPASPRAPVFPPPRPIAIRYYDANTGKFLEWVPFHGWLWQTPHALDSAMDYHGHTVQAQSIVTVLAQFVGLDNTLRQAILDTISPPSRAPSLLRQVVPGDKLKVLRLFSIRDTTWLACVPLIGGKPGFMPLKATALQNRPAPELPSPLPAPLHGSARSFEATYRFVTSSGQSRLVRCRGVVQPFGIDYHAKPPPSEPGLPQPAVTWLRVSLRNVTKYGLYI